MKPHHIVFISILTALVLTLGACSYNRSSKMTTAAAELGEKHAAMLCDTALSSYELHYRILNVRAREWQMRSNGFDKAADEYIASFQAYISEHNSELAAELDIL